MTRKAYFIATEITSVPIPAKVEIPAGTMFVVPHDEDFKMPEYSILLAGQELPRDAYPALSAVYANSGGFYTFTLEDLTQDFIIGFDERGEIIWGDGAVYYETLPFSESQRRDIR